MWTPKPLSIDENRPLFTQDDLSPMITDDQITKFLNTRNNNPWSEYREHLYLKGPHGFFEGSEKNLTDTEKADLKKDAKAAALKKVAAAKILGHANKGEAFTLDIGGKAAPKTGFQVAIPGHEYKKKAVTASGIQKWLKDNQAVLSKPNVFVGGWKDENGFYWLEPSENIADRDTAMKEGKERGQLAIWDNELEKEIAVPKGGAATQEPEVSPVKSVGDIEAKNDKFEHGDYIPKIHQDMNAYDNVEKVKKVKSNGVETATFFGGDAKYVKLQDGVWHHQAILGPDLEKYMDGVKGDSKPLDTKVVKDSAPKDMVLDPVTGKYVAPEVAAFNAKQAAKLKKPKVVEKDTFESLEAEKKAVLEGLDKLKHKYISDEMSWPEMKEAEELLAKKLAEISDKSSELSKSWTMPDDKDITFENIDDLFEKAHTKKMAYRDDENFYNDPEIQEKFNAAKKDLDHLYDLKDKLNIDHENNLKKQAEEGLTEDNIEDRLKALQSKQYNANGQEYEDLYTQISHLQSLRKKWENEKKANFLESYDLNNLDYAIEEYTALKEKAHQGIKDSANGSQEEISEAYKNYKDIGKNIAWLQEKKEALLQEKAQAEYEEKHKLYKIASAKWNKADDDYWDSTNSPEKKEKALVGKIGYYKAMDAASSLSNDEGIPKLDQAKYNDYLKSKQDLSDSLNELLKKDNPTKEEFSDLADKYEDYQNKKTAAATGPINEIPDAPNTTNYPDVNSKKIKLLNEPIKLDTTYHDLGGNLTAVDPNELSSALDRWFGSSEPARSAIFDNDTDSHYFTEGKNILHAVATNNKTAPELQRGITVDKKTLDRYLDTKNTHDLNLASWTTSSKIAHSFSHSGSGDYHLILHAAPGARALDVDDLSPHSESEWITQGRFVHSGEAPQIEYKDNVPYYHVYLKQAGVFADVPQAQNQIPLRSLWNKYLNYRRWHGYTNHTS